MFFSLILANSGTAHDVLLSLAFIQLMNDVKYCRVAQSVIANHKSCFTLFHCIARLISLKGCTYCSVE